MIRILTAYHKPHEKYLDGCIESVKKSFNGCAVHDVQYDWGRGKAWAMNTMFSRVKEDDIVGFLDADDFARPEMMWNLPEMILSDVVYGDVMNCDKNHSHEVFKSQEFDKDAFKERNFIPYSGTLVNGWLLKKVSYPDLYHGNDWNFWWSLTQYTDKFHYTGCTVAKRRTWTSYKRCNIPVYRKIKRLYYQWRVKQENKKYY